MAFLAGSDARVTPITIKVDFRRILADVGEAIDLVSGDTTVMKPAICLLYSLGR